MIVFVEEASLKLVLFKQKKVDIITNNWLRPVFYNNLNNAS